MIDLLEAVRRVVSRWVETTAPITADVSPGDTVISVDSSIRFEEGDEVMIESPLDGEPNLVIDEIIDRQTIRLATPVYNSWTTDQNVVLRKLINGMFVEGIYLGNPEVIMQYPAITINGTTVTSEPMTLDSTKERYEVEVSIHVEDATQEDGYRFLWMLTHAVIEGLKRNVQILVNSYDMTTITQDIAPGDEVIAVADSSVFHTPLTDGSTGYPRISDARVIIEDIWKSYETRVQEIIDPTHVTIRPYACDSFIAADNVIAIRPKRFIYNSWPHHVDIGKQSKGTLLQTAVIRWFAEEEKLRDEFRSNPHLR